MLPYQLPSCVQFVYADMNQAELDRLPDRVVPGPEHMPAAALTAHYVKDLVPRGGQLPRAGPHLRLQAARSPRGGCRPMQGEPRVNPLHRGAGQFPTIGRAALFGTFLDGPRPGGAGHPHSAIGRLAKSGEDLDALGGRPPRGVDVFVAFSVAGGTGGGIFYDYLHLIGDMFRQTAAAGEDLPAGADAVGVRARPGRRRAAELNAGRALLDLFRLVDQQNGADARARAAQQPATAAGRPRGGGVSTTRRTADSAAPGARADRVPVLPARGRDPRGHAPVDRLAGDVAGRAPRCRRTTRGPGSCTSRSRTASSTRRRTGRLAAGNGIGNRGVSTALVASLTVPVDELAGHRRRPAAAHAIEQLSEPDRQRWRSNRADMEDFLVKSGIHPVLLRQPQIDFTEPQPAHGAREVTAALNDRREAMRVGIDSLRTSSAGTSRSSSAASTRTAPPASCSAGWTSSACSGSSFGHPELTDEADEGGRRRAAAPQAGRAGGAGRVRRGAAAGA